MKPVSAQKHSGGRKLKGILKRPSSDFSGTPKSGQQTRKEKEAQRRDQESVDKARGLQRTKDRDSKRQFEQFGDDDEHEPTVKKLKFEHSDGKKNTPGNNMVQRSANKKAPHKKPNAGEGRKNLSANTKVELDKTPKADRSESKESLAVKNSSQFEEAIKKEENRRREERNKKSLFLKGVAKKMRINDIKALHPKVISVRVLSANAWLIFKNEAACNEAHVAISARKLNDSPMPVDFCGSKSKNPEDSSKPVAKRDMPIDPTQIVIAGIPKAITKEHLCAIFPSATKIVVVDKIKTENAAQAFVKFDDGRDALAAFERNANLQVGGVPVEVFFARIIVGKEKLKKPTDSQKGEQKKVAVVQTKQEINEGSDSKENDSEDGDSGSDSSDNGEGNSGVSSSEDDDGDDSEDDTSAIDSSEEGIEEEDEGDD